VFIVVDFFNVKKKRTNFGEWLDWEGLTQLELEERAKLSRGRVLKLCNDKSYRLKYETAMKIQKALKLMGKSAPGNFFDIR